MDQWTDRLSEYLDDELDARERRELEAHLKTCESCRATLDELGAVVSRAQAMTDRAPDADLWPGIAERVAAARASRRYTLSMPQLAAAGIALMVLSGGAVWMARRQATEPPATQAAIIGDPTAVPVNLADAPYDQAVADLQGALEAGRSRLDPATIKVLEDSLASIDQAIDQSQRALAADPANTYLYSHLAAARQRKLALLRRVSALTDPQG
ncbi:MAG: zf-HC2 domain-containing protein [Vicinamibacterales bacterium]